MAVPQGHRRDWWGGQVGVWAPESLLKTRALTLPSPQGAEPRLESLEGPWRLRLHPFLILG
jgi:hypothetical protein